VIAEGREGFHAAVVYSRSAHIVDALFWTGEFTGARRQQISHGLIESKMNAVNSC
jgi:hypothetical protein